MLKHMYFIKFCKHILSSVQRFYHLGRPTVRLSAFSFPESISETYTGGGGGSFILHTHIPWGGGGVDVPFEDYDLPCTFWPTYIYRPK